MPLVAEYRAAYDSPHADIVNSGTRDGSLIKSAVFLCEFVTVPWVHVDIAGTAYLGAEKPYGPKGATGAAVAALVRLALDFTAAEDESRALGLARTGRGARPTDRTGLSGQRASRSAVVVELSTTSSALSFASPHVVLDLALDLLSLALGLGRGVVGEVAPLFLDLAAGLLERALDSVVHDRQSPLMRPG